jgi:hypothetical protein
MGGRRKTALGSLAGLARVDGDECVLTYSASGVVVRSPQFCHWQMSESPPEFD